MTVPVPSSSPDNEHTPTPTPAPPPPAPAATSPPPPPSTASREATPAPDVDGDDKLAPADDDPLEDIIDMETLSQILDLDEDDSHEFSRGMAWAYFEQAAQTFEDMDAAYAAKDLPKLSALGHFLKGSSAALGISKVQASCERIQHYGDLRDEEANRDLAPPEALDKINLTLRRVKLEYAAAEKCLKEYYKDLGGGDDTLS